MLGILAYLGAVIGLFAAAAFGLMVVLSESAGVGRNLSSSAEANRAALQAKPARAIAAGPDASAAARTTGSAPKAERPIKDARAKATKNRSAKTDKRKKQASQARRERP
jgi:hypothetical protein